MFVPQKGAKGIKKMEKTKAQEMLLRLSQQRKGNWDDMYQDIKERIKPSEEKNILDSDYFTMIDQNYPDSFKNSFKPPFVVYYKGDMDLISSNTKKIFIASRNNKETLNKLLDNLTKTFNNNYIIVMILGIINNSKKIIDFANKNNIKIIAVSSCSFSELSEEKQSYVNDIMNNGGLVLTETPYGVKENSYFVESQQRLAVAIADDIVILPQEEKTYLKFCVNCIFKMAKDDKMFVVPSLFDSNDKLYTNKLILNGASALVDTKQLVEE